MAALTVTAAAPHERAEALAVLFSRHSVDERAACVEDALAAAAHGELSLDGLLIARRGSHVVGAVLVVLPARSGGTAFVWPPAVADATEAADVLMQEAGRRIDASGAALAQCLLEPGDTTTGDVLTRNGFVHLADLQCMQRRLDRPLPARVESGLGRTNFNFSENASRFARVLEQTYLGTLDCPALVGQRTGHEALQGHRQSGVFDPRLWSIYTVGERDAAVLLLTEHPEENSWEIVYLGVVPEFRGRGYGQALVLEALWRAKRSGCATVQLAVDCRNRFARRLYDELGFEDVAARAAYVRTRRGER